jgi:transcription elongation factor GreA
MTRQGHNKLEEELERLRKVELPRNVVAIAEARAHGDISENAEFHAAKERQSIIAAKIKELENNLAQVEVIDPLPAPEGKVVFGAMVTVFDPCLKTEIVYQIVGRWESDPASGRISLTSPLGQALLGREEGDEVKFHTPGGVRNLEVVEIAQGK